jgi:hypothetical protein
MSMLAAGSLTTSMMVGVMGPCGVAFWITWVSRRPTLTGGSRDFY